MSILLPQTLVMHQNLDLKPQKTLKPQTSTLDPNLIQCHTDLLRVTTDDACTHEKGTGARALLPLRMGWGARAYCRTGGDGVHSEGDEDTSRSHSGPHDDFGRIDEKARRVPMLSVQSSSSTRKLRRVHEAPALKSSLDTTTVSALTGTTAPLTSRSSGMGKGRARDGARARGRAPSFDADLKSRDVLLRARTGTSKSRLVQCPAFGAGRGGHGEGRRLREETGRSSAFLRQVARYLSIVSVSARITTTSPSSCVYCVLSLALSRLRAAHVLTTLAPRAHITLARRLVRLQTTVPPIHLAPRRPHCIALPERYRACSVQLRLRADWYRVDGGGVSTGEEQGGNSWASLAWVGNAWVSGVALHDRNRRVREGHWLACLSLGCGREDAPSLSQCRAPAVARSSVAKWRKGRECEHGENVLKPLDVSLPSLRVEEPWAGTDTGRCILWSAYSHILSGILLAPVAARLPSLRVCELVRLAVPVFHCNYKYKREPDAEIRVPHAESAGTCPASPTALLTSVSTDEDGDGDRPAAVAGPGTTAASDVVPGAWGTGMEMGVRSFQAAESAFGSGTLNTC
ncbi:hypothetical protein B0H14DRAFT_2615614 [Mycena olivaceomarginata]|nr:hypothetical protein B0H14DRAFT_2615614 [Mycena olivaceomarginata]